MISERLERADVDLYLLDDSRQWAALRASSSLSSSELMKSGQRVVVGENNAVGRTARRGTMTITPMHPENSSELNTTPPAEVTLPLAVRGKIIGVLDVRSKGAQAGSQGEVEILQLLADQLAASVETARLVSES